jgi:hypothetical protein
MEKKRQWQKPELGVVAKSEPEKITGISRRVAEKYYLGPIPTPPFVGSFKSEREKYYLGPIPTPPFLGTFNSGSAK